MAEHLELLTAAARAAGIDAPEIALPQDRWVELGGLRFHYLDWGNEAAPPVVLLHGGGLTAHTWDLAALLLRERYHLIALDQRGHGDTDWTPEGQLGEDGGQLMLEDTRRFIEHLGYERIGLVGMSMGGMNSIRYAARHPGRLQALGIVDVAPETLRAGQVEMESFRRDTQPLERFEDYVARAQRFSPQRPVDHLRYSLTHALRRLPDGRYVWKQDQRRRAQRERPSEEERTRRSQALWGDVRSIRTPTLLFRGAESKILAPAVAERMIKEMVDARLVVIARATHNVHSDNPAGFARELDRFLAARL